MASAFETLKAKSIARINSDGEGFAMIEKNGTGWACYSSRNETTGRISHKYRGSGYPVSAKQARIEMG